MHTSIRTLVGLRFVRSTVLCSLLLSCFGFLSESRAQSGTTGRIVGRIFNPTTGEFVRNAEIRLQIPDRVTYSEEGGNFQLDDVPVGPASLQVTFTGYATANANVVVTANQATTCDLDLLPAKSGAARDGEVLKLEQFVVTSEREGNAKAIMQQRRNMNIGTSVASDVFGDVAEGNVGEFLKFLPGVDLEYVDAETRGPRLGGLDPQYVGVTMDGQKMASADGYASYNAMLNGGAGGAVRSTGFEMMSITSIESIEINRTSSADMDADAPAGTINMKTKRAFDRKGRRIDWQVSLSGNSDEFTFRKTYGPGDTKNHLVRPNFTFDYSDVFLQQRLGIRLGLSQSSVLYEQQYVTNTYNRTPTTADPRPTVLTAIAFTDGPKIVDRFTTSLTADYKASPRLVLSLTAMFNSYDASTYTKALTFTLASSRANVLGDGLSDLRTTSGTVAYGGQNFNKLTNTVTLTPRFEYKIDRLTIDGATTYSYSKNDYENTVRGTIRVETLGTVAAGFTASRPDASAGTWSIAQTSGNDWSNLANFTNPRISADDGRFAVVELYNSELNARYTLPWSLPTFVKFGGKINEEYRLSDNRTVYNSYAYVGPGGGTTGSFAGFASPRGFSARFGDIQALKIANMPTMVNRTALGELVKAHPEYFVSNATVENYYSAYYANKRDFKQTVGAAYGMANTRVGRWQFQGGVRWERTETESKEFDPRPLSQVQAAGFPVSTTTRRATTIPGIDYQFGSRPRVTRDGVYDNFFPSISAKYALRPNLHAQVGYSYAISRAPIDSLAGVWSIDEVNMIVTAPNPNLKPELSNNYVARLAYYFEPAGSFSMLVQQNEISNLRQTRSFSAAAFGYADDPVYAGYTFQAPDNTDQLYRYRNFELSYNQQLIFLPGALRGLSVNLAYTRSYANLRRPGVVPNKVTSSLGWNYQRFSLRLSGVWLDDAEWTTVVGRYQRHNLKIDLNASIRLARNLSLFCQGRNIFNDPQILQERDPAGLTPKVLYRYGNYGTSWVFGLKGNF